MGMITTIEHTKRAVTVYMDGVKFISLSPADFAALPLAEGEEVDGTEYVDRLSAVQSPRAYTAALEMLNRRDTTAASLREALCRKGFARPAAEAAAQRLVENRLIDDARYADRFVELRQGNSAGKYEMMRKLRAKGVDAEAAEKAVEGMDEEQQLSSAIQWARKLHRRYEGLPAREARAKLSQALARRGFSWDVIASALDRVGTDGDDEG